MSIQAYLANVGEDIKAVFEHLIARIEALEGKTLTLASPVEAQPVSVTVPSAGAGPVGLTDIDVVTGTTPVQG